MTRSSSAPKRLASLSKQIRAECSSPVCKHESIRFSYVVHISADSAGAYKELREYDEIEAGIFCSKAGAC
jgi:hypothetical protein